MKLVLKIFLFLSDQLTRKIKENQEKIKLNKQLPYLVSNVVEILDVEKDEDEDGIDVNGLAMDKAAVIKTSTRQVFKSNSIRQYFCQSLD